MNELHNVVSRTMTRLLIYDRKNAEKGAVGRLWRTNPNRRNVIFVCAIIFVYSCSFVWSFCMNHCWTEKKHHSDIALITTAYFYFNGRIVSWSQTTEHWHKVCTAPNRQWTQELIQQKHPSFLCYQENRQARNISKSWGRWNGCEYMGIAGSGMTDQRPTQPRLSQGKNVPSASSSNTAKNKGGGPTKMSRAKHWSPEAENAYRFQSAGFRNTVEYEETYREETGFVRQLQVKSSGYFMYFRQTRECEDKYLGKTKLYTYWDRLDWIGIYNHCYRCERLVEAGWMRELCVVLLYL